MKQACVISTLLPAVFAATAQAIEIDSFSAPVNDRFANSSSFVMDDYDLSAVGLVNSSNSDRQRWATLVDANVFITANHFPTAIGDAITFHANNDPNGISVTRTITSVLQLGTSDVRVGRLDKPLPDLFTPLAFATETITSETEFGNSVYAGEVAYHFGRSPTSSGYGSNAATDQAVGRNVLDLWIDDDVFDGIGVDTLAAAKQLSGEGNYVTYETMAVDGDSGAPVLVDIGGELRIVGMNWYIAENFDILSGPGVRRRDITGFSYIGNVASALQAYIDANSLPAIVLGDIDHNGIVGQSDIDPFVDLLLSMTYQDEADLNLDGVVNGLDVEPFIARLEAAGALPTGTKEALSALATTVPEPGTVGVVVMFVSASTLYRRRSC